MERRRVIIIDDEIWIARSLAELIDWEAEGFRVAGVFTDPREALEQIRELEPELILLDIRMPQLSGEQILDILQEEGIGSSIILISAYSDFSVAQKAIACGAAGYILKPIDGEELLKAVRRLHSARPAPPADPTDTAAVLARAFSGGTPGEADYAVALASPAEAGGLFAASGLLTVGPVPVYGNRCLWFLHPQGRENWRAVRERAEASGCSVGVSGMGTLPDRYPVLYQQALCALYNTVLREKNGCYFYQPPDMAFVRDWYGRLAGAFEARRADQVRQELQRLVESWKKEGNPGTLSLLTMQLTSRVLQENGALAEAPLSSQNFFSAFTGLPDVCRYLREILCSADGRKAREFLMEPKAVAEIRGYIERHFAEELNLAALSQQFFLSSSYISDMFKRHTGYTVTGYILKVRMEQAARLLRTTDKSLVVIADQVGYGDYNYFCRLFKRTFKVTPNSYRRGPGG